MQTVCFREGNPHHWSLNTAQLSSTGTLPYIFTNPTVSEKLPRKIFGHSSSSLLRELCFLHGQHEFTMEMGNILLLWSPAKIRTTHHFLGGWTNPSEKYATVKLDYLPRDRGEHKKNIWNHHLDIIWRKSSSYNASFAWKKPAQVQGDKTSCFKLRFFSNNNYHLHWWQPPWPEAMMTPWRWWTVRCWCVPGAEAPRCGGSGDWPLRFDSRNHLATWLRACNRRVDLPPPKFNIPPEV